MMGTNPYVGPRTFDAQEADRYFGRDREALELYHQIVSQRLVLFYAQSGAGKSSLLRTRVIPRLRDEGFAVLPTGRVGGRPPEGVGNIDNIYVFNLLLRLDQGHTSPGQLAQLSLADFMGGLTSEDGIHYTYQPDSTELDEDGGEEDFPMHVLLIDQFEEVVTNHPDRWQERAGFFQQLNEAMTRDSRLSVLLCFREDYLAAMDPFAPLMADRMRTQYYMQRLAREAALEAVSKPAAAFGRPFAPGCAERLTDHLREIRTESGEVGLGQFVEPVQLQVVCYRLWENLKDQPAGPITEADLDQAGDIDGALSGFYNAAVSAVVDQTEVDELTLRNWFEKKLITATGTRGTVHQGPQRTEGLTNEVVSRLADRFLLRPEYRAGETWYELIHDRMVDPILAANRQWLQQQDPLVRAAHAWHESDQSSAHLLADGQLRDLNILPHEGEAPNHQIWRRITLGGLVGLASFILAYKGFLGETSESWARALLEFLFPGSNL